MKDSAINTDVTIVLPFNTLNIKNESEMLFCESLIIGEVPQTYLMAESTGDMLNLVPD